MQIDIPTIQKLSRQKERENEYFRRKVKYGINYSHAGFLRIVDNVQSQIDCTQCGHCCQILSPIVTQRDIKRISPYLKLSPQEFTVRYLEQKQNNIYRIKQKPCPFLEDKKCSIYLMRPKECRDYPHLTKREPIIFRMYNFLTNVSICPIAFNVWEEYKGVIKARFR